MRSWKDIQQSDQCNMAWRQGDKSQLSASIVVHVCNLTTQEAKAGGSQVQGQSELHSDFEASLNPLEKQGIHFVIHWAKV
jgi:hypothetical protein